MRPGAGKPSSTELAESPGRMLVSFTKGLFQSLPVPGSSGGWCRAFSAPMAMKSLTAGGGEGIGWFPCRDARHYAAVFGGTVKFLIGL
jgi:hypothetical protein